MRLDTFSMMAIPGLASRASRRLSARLFGGCVLGLLAGPVLAGCGRDSGEGGGVGCLRCWAVRFSERGLLEGVLM